MTLMGNWLIGGSQTVAHGSGRKYTASAAGLLVVPAADAFSVHVGQFLFWSCAGTFDRPTNTPGTAPWTSPVLDNTVGGFIFPIANSAPLAWVNTAGTKV